MISMSVVDAFRDAAATARVAVAPGCAAPDDDCALTGDGKEEAKAYNAAAKDETRTGRRDIAITEQSVKA
ncbi:MAG TPA: hypothetical protein VEK37_07035 [Gemmatimonadaceae bacterium]|nr:hypothetical protein [Gemmatimonadaceae bacterium]